MVLKIGRLAALTGTNVPTIRYYEEIGLLPKPRRHGTQRSYEDSDVSRLTFIRRCREFGLPIAQTRDLLTLMHDRKRSCADARTIAQTHLAFVRAKLTELQTLEHSITGFVASCETSCAGGPGPDCVVLQDMAAIASRPPRAMEHSLSRRTANRH
jgi:DNA-binding transcriptional MerR regulator